MITSQLKWQQYNIRVSLILTKLIIQHKLYVYISVPHWYIVFIGTQIQRWGNPNQYGHLVLSIIILTCFSTYISVSEVPSFLLSPPPQLSIMCIQMVVPNEFKHSTPLPILMLALLTVNKKKHEAFCYISKQTKKCLFFIYSNMVTIGWIISSPHRLIRYLIVLPWY